VARHMEREIERLKKMILSLSAFVEEDVERAVRSVAERDTELAQGVIGADPDIDRTEVDVEEECLKILALHQPVAIDLRFIVAVLKINTDLERIGDLAVNIAERAVFLNAQPEVPTPFDFPGMARKARAMLRRSLDALVTMNAEIAWQVCAADDEVDEINRKMYVQVEDGIRQHPDQIDSLIHMLSISRHLERIADHATNIAEDVIYMIDGDIVRHRTEQYLKKESASLGPERRSP